MGKLLTRGLTLLLCACALLAPGCETQQVDDAALTAKVKARIIADGRVGATRVNVDSAGGVVTLRGEVPTEQEKQAADQVAKAVEGVRGVKNEITVNPAAAGAGVPSLNELKDKAREAARDVTQEARDVAGEAVLAGKIKARLAAAGFASVAVDLKGAEATLTGEVASEKERIAVEALLEKEPAVKKVNNQLTVKK